MLGSAVSESRRVKEADPLQAIPVATETKQMEHQMNDQPTNQTADTPTPRTNEAQQAREMLVESDSYAWSFARSLERELTTERALREDTQLMHAAFKLHTDDTVKGLESQLAEVTKERDELKASNVAMLEMNDAARRERDAALARVEALEVRVKRFAKVLIAECSEKHGLHPNEANLNLDYHVTCTVSIGDIRDLLNTARK